MPGTSLSSASPALEGEMERRTLPEVVALEATLKAQHSFRVQLRDPRLGDAEDLADLAQGQVLVVVEGDHQALALGQRLDRVGEAVLELAGLCLGLVMIGPGAWSIDARLFGRKQIDLSEL